MSSNNYGSINNTSNFSPTEFFILKETITNNLILIKRNTHKIEKTIKAIGSKSDNQELRSKIKSIQKATNDVIKRTTDLIKKLSSIVQFDNSKTQKIQSEKIVNEFQLIISRYVQTEKLLSTKIRKAHLVNFNEEESDMPSTSAQQNNQDQIQADFRFENQLYEERQRDVSKIEFDIVDISKIMDEIATLVHEQGESIETIQTATVATENHIEIGVSEIAKSSIYQQKYRKKVILILIICLIVALLIAFSLYSKLKN